MGGIGQGICCPKEGFEPTWWDAAGVWLVCKKNRMGPAVAPKGDFPLSKVFLKTKSWKSWEDCSKLVELDYPEGRICPHLKKAKIMERKEKDWFKRGQRLLQQIDTSFEGLRKSAEEYTKSLKSVDSFILLGRGSSSVGVIQALTEEDK